MVSSVSSHACGLQKPSRTTVEPVSSVSVGGVIPMTTSFMATVADGEQIGSRVTGSLCLSSSMGGQTSQYDECETHVGV